MVYEPEFEANGERWYIVSSYIATHTWDNNRQVRKIGYINSEYVSVDQ